MLATTLTFLFLFLQRILDLPTEFYGYSTKGNFVWDRRGYVLTMSDLFSASLQSQASAKPWKTRRIIIFTSWQLSA